ncbi:MAG: HEAT repeat domain-containing protein [Candidatus Fermentibacteraceae bacterium]|nr:HEAT repeat domain-containing protein [Candidatus Fermentibacteraceae bacterium]
MTYTGILIAALLGGLQPGDPWPAALDPAFSSALDSISIARGQLDFDRHWATSVHLADSTVILAIQSIESLPVILENRLETLVDYRSLEPEDQGMSALHSAVMVLEDADSLLCERLDGMSPSMADSLMTVVPSLWLSENDPVDWDSVLEGWGLSPVEGEQMEMDTLAVLLESCPAPVKISPEELARAAMSLREAQWPGELSVTLPGVSGTTVTFCFDGPVRYVVGGRGRNTYTGDCPFELIIDIGGDDFYGEGVGGAAGPAGRRISIVMDLEGDDTYRSGAPVSQGCGLLGIGGVIDLAGDDSYTAGDFSQGAGIMGQGFLIDLAGNDLQTGGTFSQGAGCLGEGMLFDGGGDDLRRVDLFGQGFGGPCGTGTLVDMNGSDCNLAGFRYSHAPLLPDDNQAMSQGFGMGLRPLIAGGVGLMADFGAGNDTYRAEVFGQGCSYFYSLGMLYDQEGQDSYQAAQYSQGSGIHLAAGCLWDGDGDDSYFSRNGPAQGSAHDLSTGFLLDGGGNDWYCSDGGQSLSLTNSASIFIDVEGSDTYCGRGGGQGDARWARGSSGAAVFIDLADGDFYTGDGSDSSLWLGGEYGVGIDLPDVTPGGLNPQDPVGDPGSLDLDSLFSVASEWEVGPNRDRVLAHREELAARGREAVEYLVENHMGTLDGLESRAMEIAFGDNVEVSLELLLACLDRIDSLPVRNGGNIVYFLGQLEDGRARIPLERLLASNGDTLSTGLTVGVVKALGEIGNAESLPVIVSLSSHPSGRIRRECAVSLGTICDRDALEVLRTLSLDPSLDVRSAAEHALRLLEEAFEEASEESPAEEPAEGENSDE